MSFSTAELKRRALFRVAFVLYQQWEEFKGGDTRLFDWLVDDKLVEIGCSKNGGEYREHVVPRVVIRDLCLMEFEKGKTAQDVVELIDDLLMIAKISKKEAHYLDHVLKLKTTMPDGWVYGSGNNKARLLVANIEIE